MSRFGKALFSASAALVAGSVLYTAAMAAPETPHSDAHREGALLARLDTNHDGLISRDEARNGAEALFSKLDLNKDGKLDRADFALIRKEQRDKMRAFAFAKLDANHDGKISQDEYMAGKKPGDAPGDAPPPGDHPGHRPHGHFGGPGGLGVGPEVMMLVHLADTDHDGSVTRAEFTAAAMTRFDAMDTNHDGKLTQEERRAGMHALREQMHAMHEAMKSGKPHDDPADKPAD